MTNIALENLELSQWMASTSSIDTLTLGELILPGAHNSGVDKKATYAGPGIAHWAACQNNSFYDQLSNGARALDARVEYHQDSRGVGTFWFQHQGVRSSRSLENLIDAGDSFPRGKPRRVCTAGFPSIEVDGNVVFDYRELNRFAVDASWAKNHSFQQLASECGSIETGKPASSGCG